jgi:hypothetical protein
MASNWSLEPNFLYRNASSRASSRSLMARRDICCGCRKGGRYQSEADIDEDFMSTRPKTLNTWNQ